MVTGLLASPEFNERAGLIKGWNEEKQRFMVEIEGDGPTALLGAKHLERIEFDKYAVGSRILVIDESNSKGAPKLHADLKHLVNNFGKVLSKQPK